MRAAAAGDERAWEQLVKVFTPVLRRVVLGFRLGEHHAEDVVQTTWLRLFLAIGSLDELAAVPGWLVTTARREAIRCLARAGRELPVDVLPTAEGAPDEDALVEGERREALRAAVGRLPERQRALAGALLTDPPPAYAALARELGMPVGSVGPIRARCLDRLRRDPALLRAVA